MDQKYFGGDRHYPFVILSRDLDDARHNIRDSKVDLKRAKLALQQMQVRVNLIEREVKAHEEQE